MPRYKALSIAEKGGLQPHLTSLGIDYNLFMQLRSLGLKPYVIADKLSEGRERPIKSRTVSGWMPIADQEEKNHATS